MKYYIYFVWGDVEPEVFGPYKTQDRADKKALELRAEEGEENGIFWMNVSSGGKITTDSYSGSFFDEVDGE